jgi:hypothetical protein
LATPAAPPGWQPAADIASAKTAIKLDAVANIRPTRVIGKGPLKRITPLVDRFRVLGRFKPPGSDFDKIPKCELGSKSAEISFSSRFATEFLVGG